MFFGDWEMRHHRDLMQEDAETIARGAMTGSMLSPRTVKDSGIFTTCGTVYRKA